MIFLASAEPECANNSASPVVAPLKVAELRQKLLVIGGRQEQ